ncbi:unnamed protein product [Toxocara canis]|uniref:DUF19 domain-containing protein n=1 Tax=Toxocara canis TaxID=6265 RepID=A0A183V8J2_TOXCA|nr:unnamed protein product [Toxocara canis]
MYGRKFTIEFSDNDISDASPIAINNNALNEPASDENGRNDHKNENSHAEFSASNRTNAIKILDGELFTYVVSRECNRNMRDKARICIAPLMRTWIHLREQRPELAQMSFPLYTYTRTELLELCDGYANLFLCAGFEPIMKCLNDELVRFARDHLGYICSPQNIERFMRQYDCLMELEVLNLDGCRQFVEGVAEPSKDQRKCRGVKQYYDCMKPSIIRRCNTGALNEFERSIEEFGCVF